MLHDVIGTADAARILELSVEEVDALAAIGLLEPLSERGDEPQYWLADIVRAALARKHGAEQRAVEAH